MELFSIFIGAFLVQNIILSLFTGMCPFIGVSKKASSALGMGLAVIFVITLSATLIWPLYTFVLVPNNIEFMRTIVFILLIATVVQFVEMFMKKYMKSLYKSLGIYLPLITTNCAVLGAVIFNVNRNLDFGGAVANAFGISAGFALVIYLFSTMRERIDTNTVPRGFKGVPIALVTAAIMAMAFAGFAGLGS
ncbi:MAG: RnfABCDGE type electron transport complex subunit A [Defluviitaleaceae bacterium]|nr:RnfABCDGE type electron transport complex subunit A [Defluviitaleaceae bacterium]